MAVERRHWTCHRCGTTWEIPADTLDPEQCPNCPKMRFVKAAPVLADNAATPTFRGVFWRAVAATFGCGLLLCLVAYLTRAGFQSYYQNNAHLHPGMMLNSAWVLEQTVGITVLAALCLIPPWIAIIRKLRHQIPISILSVFGGWTCIGWIAAMIWACWPSNVDRK